MLGTGFAAGEAGEAGEASEALVIFLLCAVFAAGFAFASYVLAPRDVDEPQTLGALFLWIPIVLCMVYTAGRGSMELAWSIEERWLGTSDGRTVASSRGA